MRADIHQLDIEGMLREHCILVSPDERQPLIEIAQQFGLLAVDGAVEQEQDSEV